MTPLAKLADALDACREAGIRVRAEVLPDEFQSYEENSVMALTPAERSRRYRERRASRGRDDSSRASRDAVTDPVSPSQTLPINQKGSDLQKEAENKADPEEASHNLPVSVGSRAAGTVTERHETSRDAVTKKRAPKRGPLWHFVPDDWVIRDSHRTLALGLLLDVEREADAFRDHEFNPPRSDPDKAFSGWLRKAAEYRRRGGSVGGRGELVERSMRIIREANGANGASGSHNAAAAGAKVKGLFG